MPAWAPDKPQLSRVSGAGPPQPRLALDSSQPERSHLGERPLSPFGQPIAGLVESTQDAVYSLGVAP